jgi:protein gp37
MGKDSGIQWTHHTFNPWRGCTRVSEACRFCYAETLSKRNPSTLGVWGPKGTRVVASEAMRRAPLKWDREAGEKGERHRVFCASLADIFEDWPGFMVDSRGLTLHVNASGAWKPGPLRDGRECGFVPVTMGDCRDRLFELILATPNLDWLLLTKRPENIERLWPVGHEFTGPGPVEWPNLWLGCSVEDQATAAERIPHLLRCPAAVRFLSVEPQIGSIDLRRGVYTNVGGGDLGTTLDGIGWLIQGGESGPHARPFEVGWARGLRDQCAAAGVAFFLKQLGSEPRWSPASGPCGSWPDHVRFDYQRAGEASSHGIRLKDSHGGDESEFPHDLRGCRAFPRSEVAHAG